MRKPTKFAIRGAMGFGSTGVILPVLAMLLAAYEGPVSPYSYCLPEDPLPVWLELPILASIVCVAGMLGAAFALFGTLNWRRAAIGFGLAAIPALLVFFYISDTIHGTPGVLQQFCSGTLGFGAGLALFGGMGAGCLRPRLALSGAVAFGLSGALWGALISTLPLHNLSFIVSPAAPLALGGALFGLFLGRLEQNPVSPPSKQD